MARVLMVIVSCIDLIQLMEYTEVAFELFKISCSEIPRYQIGVFTIHNIHRIYLSKGKVPRYHLVLPSDINTNLDKKDVDFFPLQIRT